MKWEYVLVVYQLLQKDNTHNVFTKVAYVTLLFVLYAA